MNNQFPCDCTYTCPDASTGPTSCTWAKNDPCPAGFYCDAPTCGQGTCVAKMTTDTAVDDPQCGCDGLTYFNPSVAAKVGMATHGTGACAADTAVTCGGPLGAKCPTDAFCDRDVGARASCNAVEPSGTCWMMPASCQASANQAKSARACSGGQCGDVCTAIRAQVVWFDDSTCPK